MAISILTYSSNTTTSNQPWTFSGNAAGWWIVVIHAQAGGQLADMGGDPGQASATDWPPGAWQLLAQVDAGTGLPKIRVWATLLVDSADNDILLPNPAGVDCHSYIYYLDGVRPGTDASDVLTVGAATSGNLATSQAAPLYTPDNAGLLIGAWVSGALTNYTALGGLTARPEVDGTASTSRAGEQTLSAAGPSSRVASASVAAPWAAVTIAARANAGGALTFPQAPLKMRTELAPGANPNQDPATWAALWTDIAADAKPRDGGVTITRGRADESSTISPSSMTVTLDNTAGKYVRLNPNSPLYGQLAKNTPIQFWVDYGYGWVRRYLGFISEFPPRSLGGQADEHMPIEAAGVTRRLARGRVLDSPLFRAITAHNVSYTAYWPLETDGSSPTPGVGPLRLSGPVEFSDAGPVGSAGEITMPIGTSASSSGLGMKPTTGWQVSFWLDIPADSVDSSPVVGWLTPGAIYSEWFAYVNSGQPGKITVEVFNPGVDEVFIIGTNDIRGQGPVLVTVIAGQQSGQVYISVSINNVRAPTDYTFAFGDFVRPITSIGINNIAGFDASSGVTLTGSISHLYVTREEPAHEGSYGWLLSAGRGYAGERAADRVRRLSAEENLPVVITGDDGTSEPMGPQPIARFLDIAGDAEATDGGLLYERRDGRLAYQSRAGRYNVKPSLTLAYDAGHVAPPLEPTDDDQHVLNDMTVTRVDGGSARVIDQANVDSAGQYSDSADVNVYDDDQLADQAGWRVHVGTADDLRYPAISPNLNGRPGLIPDWAALDIGDAIAIVNPGRDLPPGQIDVFAEGYSEQLDTVSWVATTNCSPGKPWKVFALDSADYGRLDTDGARLAAAVAAPALAGRVIEDFEDANLNVVIAGAGNLPWSRTNARAHGGAWSLRSGPITDNQTSDAIVTVPPGQQALAFWYRVSTEPGFDFLRVLVDGVVMFTASGESGWAKTALAVSGASTVTFRYSKDTGLSAGDDGAFIDDLVFTQTESISVETTSGPVWTTDETDLPFDCAVGGEQMTVVAVGQNLNGNPYFTADTSGWTGFQCTIARSTAQVNPAGSAATALVTPDGVSANGGINSTPTPFGSITPGKSYTVVMWVYSPGGWPDIRPGIDWQDSGGLLLSNAFAPVATTVPAGQWTRLTGVFTAPASASRAVVRGRHAGTPTTANTWYAWGLRLMPTGSPQQMTVIRSVNGVAKAHAVNDDVRLALPPILSE